MNWDQPRLQPKENTKIHYKNLHDGEIFESNELDAAYWLTFQT